MTLSAWWVVVAFLAPWLRIAAQPSISIRAAGLWGISTIAAGLVGLVLATAAGRYAQFTDPASPTTWFSTVAVLAVAVAVNGAVTLGFATMRANTAEKH